ncbi:helix-turn-helix domain-containing protein [Saccharicrinis sp. FJH54]|uniref:helix-turn-helix domain-containing protein n=1 Tax=Saccharicrinis sp. FJH54 TaxID=3344665 RepID=UPI0035D4355C
MTQPVNDKSIAVLPFVNMSADKENEYFSDGITEEIINALTKVNGLKVIARTSSFAFKGKNTDIRDIGKQLGVTSLLEGSVRKANNRVRITAQLINSLDGTHFWSETFDREMHDIFTLQDEVSLLIANQIRDNFGHFDIQDHLVKEQTKDIKAYELYLEGHYYQLKWDAESIRKATRLYEESVRYDPEFVRSYYGLVQSYGLLAAWGYMPQQEGFEKAGQSFMIAQDLDTSLPEYGMSFIGRTFWKDWDFQITYDQLQETLKQHPNYTDGLEAMAELHIAHGKFAEAEDYIRRAMVVDPVSANHHYTLGDIYYYSGRFEKALQSFNKALVINPEFILAAEFKLICLAHLNLRDDFDTFLKTRKETKLQQMLFEVLNNNFIIPSERLEEWHDVAENKQQMVPYELYILANSVHKTEAMELLEQYVAQKRGQIINFRQEPLLKPLHAFEAFHTLHISDLTDFSLPEKLNRQSAIPDSGSVERKEQMKNVVDYIQANNAFLDAQLSLSALADAVNMHPNKLSYLINEQSGSNYNEFINNYRLDYFKTLAADVRNAHLTILGMAFESGFNSKTVFNAYFKKAVGETPGEWMKRMRKK